MDVWHLNKNRVALMTAYVLLVIVVVVSVHTFNSKLDRVEQEACIAALSSISVLDAQPPRGNAEAQRAAVETFVLLVEACEPALGVDLTDTFTLLD
jgi:hypothetical protein